MDISLNGRAERENEYAQVANTPIAGVGADAVRCW